MAITFHSIPNDYSPSGNPLSYVFSSDQTGQDNFSYKVETLLGGSVVSEDRVFPQSGIRSQFDASPIIDNLLPKPRLTQGIETNLDIINTVSLKVTEVYGDPVAEQSTATSTATNTFKAELEPSEWETKDFATDYVDSKWLTDVPNNSQRVIRGQDAICSIMLSVGANAVFTFYNSTGAVMYLHLEALSVGYNQLNVSSGNMSAIYGGAGTYDDVAYFEIYVDALEVLTFTYVDDYCYDIHSLLWLNKYGTFDQYPIEHNVSTKATVESRSYKTRYGQWSGTDFDYDHTSSGNIDFEKTIIKGGSLVTNYMTDIVQHWFVTSYDSPQYYLYNINGILYRLNIKNRSYQEKKGRFEELISEEMEYERTNNYKSIKL